MTKKHSYKVGPPLRAETPAKNITFRLSEEELSALNAHVTDEKGRSELIREALEKCGLLTPPTKKRGG